jgi:predicted pyridoxine 5'-phosphate oxidase superfamily flavin-nucleotide-binding protein
MTAAPPWPTLAQPFHEGEQALQQRAGSFDTLAAVGSRVIRSFMPDQHRALFAKLPFVVLGALDASGQPWATALAGRPGFMDSPDAQHLVLNARPVAGDPLAPVLSADHAVGLSVGLLGIEPHTRRRNRMNGVVSATNAEGFAVQVSQSFGNCPKYIQAREPVFIGSAGAQPVVEQAGTLDDEARALLTAADTFYIATAHPGANASALASAAQGVDVSHRGGSPGFVRVDTDASLAVPDFAGNAFFNTLGNLALNPRCGLLFIDYATGDLLYVAATATVSWDAADAARYPGAQRVVQLQVQQMRRLRAALPLRWSVAARSPVLPVGAWV